MKPERRRASLLVVDPRGRILLFQYRPEAGSPYWATPGGGVEAEETFEEAATREAREEIGWDVSKLVPRGDRNVDLPLGGRLIRQQERLFELRVPALELAPDVRERHGLEGIAQWRWWSLGDLEEAEETVYPEDLARILRDIVGDGGRPDG